MRSSAWDDDRSSARAVKCANARKTSKPWRSLFRWLEKTNGQAHVEERKGKQAGRSLMEHSRNGGRSYLPLTTKELPSTILLSYPAANHDKATGPREISAAAGLCWKAIRSSQACFLAVMLMPFDVVLFC